MLVRLLEAFEWKHSGGERPLTYVQGKCNVVERFRTGLFLFAIRRSLLTVRDERPRCAILVHYAFAAGSVRMLLCPD